MRLSTPHRATAILSGIPVVIGIACLFIPLPFEKQHAVWFAGGWLRDFGNRKRFLRRLTTIQLTVVHSENVAAWPACSPFSSTTFQTMARSIRNLEPSAAMRIPE